MNCIMTIWPPDRRDLIRPAYRSLAERLLKAIEAGEVRSGDRLPPHRVLADQLGLSVQTVSRAYGDLMRRGVLAGQVGRGTFVRTVPVETRTPYIQDNRDGSIVVSSGTGRQARLQAVHLDQREVTDLDVPSDVTVVDMVEVAPGSMLLLLEDGQLAWFDGALSTVEVDWDDPIVVLYVSALGSSGDALGLVIACTMAWLHSAIARADGVHRILLLDEAWYLLSNLALARWLRSMFKMSRQYGLSNIIVVHRMSDLEAAGGEGSEATRIAQGLLSDTETRVIYAQSESEVADTQRLLGLTEAEADVLPRLGRGVALWKVRQQTFIVDHRLGDREWGIIDTDHSMRASAEGFAQEARV